APVTGQAVTFTSGSTDTDGTIAASDWDFDGNQDFTDGSGATVMHTFATAGTFTVRLRVTDDGGATDVDTHTVVVTQAPAPDRDHDGTPNDQDCAPDDPSIHPGAPDPPDLSFVDSNCDGVDGDASAAVFVDNTNLMASDSNPGTRALPMLTI